ncbi:fimbrial protein [Providencia rettgeri]|uniref:fimbrial protein n=1 Tax=Providencia rettgeri TaxID=587 RepID=UPI00313E70AF
MKVILYFIFIMYMPFSLAEVINITINGVVTESACELKTKNIHIDFKKIYFKTMGIQQASPSENITIELINCPSYIKNGKLIFSGTPDPINPDYFKNNGTAKNVALELYDIENTRTIKNGMTVIKSMNINTNSIVYPLTARVIGYANGNAAGTFQSLVQFTVEYN